MNLQDIKGLKYYIAYSAIGVSAFVYSGFTGWKWFNPTKTEHTKSDENRTGRTGHIYRYHK